MHCALLSPFHSINGKILRFVTNGKNKILYEEEDGALMISKSSNMMKCEVVSIGRITDNDEDFLVQVRVLSRANNNKPFMSMVDYRNYIYNKEQVK